MRPFFSDCDFPLIKEMQNQGNEVFVYIVLSRNYKAQNFLDLGKSFGRLGFYKASRLPEFDNYKKCIDLNRLYIIAPYSDNLFWLPGWIVWFIAIFHMLCKRAQIFHFDWQLRKKHEVLLRKINIAKEVVMTVHDPFQHAENPKEEIARIKCFKYADKLILLNKTQIEAFSKVYKIPKRKIYSSRLGIYDSIVNLNVPSCTSVHPYILYFGSINPYKGLEYLLQAMVIVNKTIPKLKLIIAGHGKIDFDVSQYQNLDCIEWRNRYINNFELKNLVINALFSVCPYVSATQSGVVQTSFALGCPVLATDVGALAEYVKDNLFGKIVPPKDCNVLANAIIELYNNPHHLSEYRTNINEIWRKEVSWTPIVNEYINIYNS